MRITEAARQLGTSPRMLRYREMLGLLPVVRGSRAGHRQFGPADLAAVTLALDLERRHDISPAALAFGLRVLAEPRVRAEVAELARRIGRIAPPPAHALDFEKERALRLLSMSGRASPGARAPGPPTTRPADADRPPAAASGSTAPPAHPLRGRLP